MKSFSDWISLSVIIVYCIPVVLYFLTKQTTHLNALLGTFSTILLTEFLKHRVIKGKSTRPSGATDCNLLCDDGDQAGRPGMPSGHSSTVAFFAAYYFQETTNPWIRAALLGYASLVMWSRYEKRCHRPSQIATGAFIGILMCVLFRT